MLSPVTVLEVIQRSTEFLTRKGVESARLQTELLLAHVLKLPRMQLYLNFERVLSPHEQDQVRELIKRRAQREPLQHILGSTCFCGLEIAVNRHVLIPRPETELLAEQGWTFLNQRPERPAAAALDFGTGSGCVAVALAVKSPAAQILAFDIAPEAIEAAQRNATQNGVASRIRFLLGNGLAAVPAGLVFDLIISNPPYIPTAEINKLEPEVRDYDPRVALDGGADGLKFYRQLAGEAGRLLKPDGKVMLEFGDGQEKPLAELFEKENWIVERVVEDYTNRPRILIARRLPSPAGLN